MDIKDNKCNSKENKGNNTLRFIVVQLNECDEFNPLLHSFNTDELHQLQMLDINYKYNIRKLKEKTLALKNKKNSTQRDLTKLPYLTIVENSLLSFLV